MENVTEALYMAFGVLIFVLALSLAISSFSIVRITATTIINNLDKEKQYSYIYGTSGNSEGDTIQDTDTSRIVGKETIVPTLYRAFIENYTVRFYNQNGNKLMLFQIKDDDKNSSTYGQYVDTNEIDLQAGGIGTHDQAKEFISALLTKTEGTLISSGQTQGKYVNFKVLPGSNFRDIINNGRFKESLGIYYLEDLKPNFTEDINKTEKRVITYRLI